MKKLKWFVGGKDRSEVAISIIDNLLDNLDDDTTRPLQEVLTDFKVELEKRESAVPYILSRMNLTISTTMHKNGITLPKDQQEQLQQLTQLSSIYYGY